MTIRTQTFTFLRYECLLVAFSIIFIFPPWEVKCRGQSITLNLEEEPLKYSDTEANNRVSDLVDKLTKGEIKLNYESERGYLRSLLSNLEISISSQVLVFSKTSMQVQHISPRNPRALYFNDDTYVGWIHGSPLVEISTNDPILGAAFYTLQMSPDSPRIRRETYNCLGCHATSMSKGIPGHAVRSGYPNFDGVYDDKKETYVTDDSSDFSKRWGGWYVTGTHGTMKHMGNTYLRGGILDTNQNGNLPSLETFFRIRNYLSPHSDIQALMVLEHQTQTHNALTLADFTLRAIQHAHSRYSEAEKAESVSKLAKEVVDRLLYCKEHPLTSAVSGTSDFGRDFQDQGPKDASGRSLRDFDMKTRMFKYPLSYLVYTKAFDSLQPSLRHEIGQQIVAVLDGVNVAQEYSHLTPILRQDIREIVESTKPDLLR